MKQGTKVLVGKNRLPATVVSVGKKIKLRMTDGSIKYVYMESLVADSIKTIPKYVLEIVDLVKEGKAHTVANMCKSIVSENSATGYVRPSQIIPSIRYAVDHGLIQKEGNKYK